MRYGRTAWTALAAASLAALPAIGFAAARPVTERERFDAEQALRGKQQALAESDQALRKADLDLRREEQNQSRWTSPLVLAIVAAAIAALGSAVVAFVNGKQQRQLERERGLANRILEREKAENQIKLERDKAQAQLRLDARQAESDRILEVIKTGESEAAAANLQFLLSSGLVSQSGLGKRLATYLATRAPGTGPTLPAADGRFRFEPGVEKLPLVAEMEKSLVEFCDYLDAVGFKRSEREVSIGVEDYPNAWYDAGSQRLVIGRLLLDDPFPAHRSYMTHVLMAAAPPRDPKDPVFQNVEAGVADYFPASFADNPILGEKAARAMKLETPYVRSLASPEGYADLGTHADLGANALFKDGEIWGSLFWDIREGIGRDAADRLLLSAWNDTKWPADQRRSTHAFLRALLAAAGAHGKTVKARLRKRGFPVPR